jgi:hypothetical protein
MTALDSSSLKFWESVGLWGFVFVWVGVAGEGVEIFIKLFQRKLYERKKFCLDVIGAVFWIVLVVALAVEFFGNVRAMRIADSINAQLDAEAGQARKDASAAIELAAKIGTTNAQLVASNLDLSIELEKLRHPRIITPEQRERFIEILSEAHNFSKTRIVVITGNTDRETERFAFQVRKVLDEAGYGDAPSKYQLPLAQVVDNSLYVTNGLPHIDLPAFEWKDAILAKIPNLSVSPLQCGKESGLVIKAPTGATDLASENLFTDRQPEIIALFSEKIPPASILPSVIVFYPTDNNPNRGFHYGYSPTKDTNAILYGVSAVFHEIGITVGKNTTTGVLPPGMLPPGYVAFFIPSQ